MPNVVLKKFGEASGSELSKINSHSKRPLSKEEVFVYTHKMAGDMIIPERYIQLTVPLLDQFVKNAIAGVAFLLNHSWSWGSPKPALPYGKVFDAWIGQEGVIEGETVSFNGSTYIVRGQEKDGISTDSIISDLETGVLFDTSIGWGCNVYECSICGNDYRDYMKCNHLRGNKYIVNDETNEVKMCYILAKPPGFLMEDSAVFDGAYPGAGTSFASQGGFENQNGTFIMVDDLKTVPLNSMILGTYSNKGGILTFVKKSDHQKIHSFSPTGEEGEKLMPIFNETTKKLLESLSIKIEGNEKLEDVLNALSSKWDSLKKDPEPAVVTKLDSTPEFMTKELATEKLGKECSSDEILKLAKEGQEYFDHVVEEAIKMGVRAEGNEFNSDTWKETFSGMSTKAILDITKSFEKQAAAKIPAGRQTTPLSNTPAPSSVPSEAYKAGSAY